MRNNASVGPNFPSNFQPDVLRAARKKAGLSQTALAELIKADRQAVWRWETGDRVPQVSTITKLAQALAISPQLLIGEPTTLAELRASRGLTQSQLAEKIGVSRVAYSHYETGRRAPDDEKRTLIAAALAVDPDTLHSLLNARSGTLGR